MLGVLSPAYMTFFRMTARSEKVGADQWGNMYYRSAPRPGAKRERRWVIYKGDPEASAIPPEWHGWMHHQTDTVPANDTGFRREWQKPHHPNMTGTTGAYRPPGHILEGGQRGEATGDYEPWRPPE